MPLVEIFCMIEFEMNEPATSREGPPGQCWHNMFRNPVMVSGYPILTKHERRLGLEMPLNMIAELGGSERANEFDRKVFIKGFFDDVDCDENNERPTHLALLLQQGGRKNLLS
jgi:hypothetical protein